MNKIEIKKTSPKILIIKPSSLGDIIHTLPMLNALVLSFPKSEIHWVVARGFEDIIKGHPMINKLWVINKDSWKKPSMIINTLGEFVQMFKALKFEDYDIVFDVQGLFRSGVLAYATRSQIIVGFEESREGSSCFYTHKIKGGINIHAVDRYLKLAASIGCRTEDASFPMPFFEDSEFVTKIKRDMGSYAVIIPGARKKANRWGAEKYGRLASMLNIRFLIVGGRSDDEIGQKIETIAGSKALSIVGKTDFKELICVLKDAKYVISNDTGPMHIAAALGTPVIAIFGPANPARTGPYGKKNIVIKSEVPCSPCYRRECKDPKCMNEISVEQVYRAVNEFIL
jgi:lipopolysaccharide heptosyltransferase I